MKKILLLFAIAAISLTVKADEGMWFLKELNQQSADRMKELGFTFPMDSIYSEKNPSLKDAVVLFDRGCTGVMVSNKGLVFTNHHCGYSSIQKLSSLEHDYLKDGFASQSLKEEIPSEGLTVAFLESIEDITAHLTSTLLEEDDEKTRENKISNLSYELRKSYHGKPYTYVSITPFYAKNKYYLLTYKIYTDVRLAFAPPSSIGQFGGETDNWTWPRHTGDFSVFRVYANENNEPAEYAETNVPYKPKYSVPISIKGYSENDYAMTIGFPGSTKRYMTSWGIDQMVESEHIPRIAVRGVKQEIWKKAMNDSDEIRIKYASKYAMSSNYWKNAIGMNEAIVKNEVVENKKELEKNFTEWVSKKEDRKEKYKNTLDLIREGYTDSQQDMKIHTYFSEVFESGIEIIQRTGVPLVVAQSKKETNFDQIEKRLIQYGYKDYDASVDKQVLIKLLDLYAKSVPAEYLPSIYTKIQDEFDNDYKLYADWLFDNTKFTDLDTVMRILRSEDNTSLFSDPAVELAQSVTPISNKLRYDIDINYAKISHGNRFFMMGLMEMNPEKVYHPDANSTPRLSYGSVKGYSPADAVSYNYYSTTRGVAEKEKAHNPEFAVQQYVLDHLVSKDFGEYADKDGSMHLAFLSNNDITGGNSGSPVFNGQAELLGLAFDGNWESLSGDILFNPELQRCINVDVRYMLYIIDKVMKCPRLIDELEIVK